MCRRLGLILLSMVRTQCEHASNCGHGSVATRSTIPTPPNGTNPSLPDCRAVLPVIQECNGRTRQIPADACSAGILRVSLWSFEHGFLRVQCTECHHKHLVALVVKDEAFAQAVAPDAWRKVLLCWLMKFYLNNRYANGCSAPIRNTGLARFGLVCIATGFRNFIHFHGTMVTESVRLPGGVLPDGNQVT